ncbi:hypothetical protein L208DRAFT_1349074 [Tricholoma matsutake]|nr:hypothetical protein L208DRAFT_1349074 [Tricholoma matsutake 945]
MTKPEIVHCANRYLWRVIYGLGPYIASYPEQALLACIVQGWCPTCTAPSRDLDSHQHIHRSHAHSDILGEEFELGVLCNEYGIVGNAIPFTNAFP